MKHLYNDYETLFSPVTLNKIQKLACHIKFYKFKNQSNDFSKPSTYFHHNIRIHVRCIKIYASPPPKNSTI